jgi:hypothetical protein
MHTKTRVLVKQIVGAVNGQWLVSTPVNQPEVGEGILHLCVDRTRDAIILRVPLDADRETLRSVVYEQLGVLQAAA